MKEVTATKRRVGPPDERFTALLRRRRPFAQAIDGHVDEEPRLLLDARLLDEHHARRERRLARVTCTLHRLAPNRLGEHVEPDRALIAPVERFEVDDGRVFGAVTLRPQTIRVTVLGARSREVRRELVLRHVDRQPETLNPWVALDDAADSDVLREGHPRQLLGRDDVRARAAQRVHVELHPLLNRRGHARYGFVEAALVELTGVAIDDAIGRRRREEPEAEHCDCRAIPAPSFAQCSLAVHS